MWGRSFAAMGIQYKGATMTLDLLDRKGKYSNGFCHWPQPAWRLAREIDQRFRGAVDLRLLYQRDELFEVSVR